MTSIEGCNALVTGANGGIGSAFVEAIADRGAARIYAAVRRPDSCASLRERFGSRLTVIALDLADSNSIDAAIAAVRDVDLLVSNAGQTLLSPLTKTDPAAIRALFEVNLFGPHRLAAGLLPGLRARSGGIITVLSMAALLPVGGAEAYSASKAAAAMLAHGIRSAARGDGVRASLVYPGFVDTPMSESFTAPKASPRQIADRALDGWLAGETAIFPDQFAAMTRDALIGEMPRILQDPGEVLGEMVRAFIAHPQAGQ